MTSNNEEKQPLGPNQEKWLHDLETTTEPQGKYHLCELDQTTGEPTGWCCLGRACAVLDEPYRMRSDGQVRVFGADGSEEYLPGSMVEKLKLAICQGILSTMNDHEGKSFKQIAVEIRANPGRFFKGSA